MIRRKYLIVTAIIFVGFLALMFLFGIIGVILYELGYNLENRDPPLPVRLMFPLFLFLWGIFIGLVVVWYYYPEIRPHKHNGRMLTSKNPLDVVKYISNENEVKVIEAIGRLPHGAYQFEISNLADLPRMKVHRVVNKLVEQDILIKMEPKDGESKNSKYYISEWLQEGAKTKTKSQHQQNHEN